MFCGGCQTTYYSPAPIDKRELSRRILARRAVIVSAPAHLARKVIAGNVKEKVKASDKVFLGTAVPLTADGYFLTAKHLVKARTENSLLMWTPNSSKPVAARLVWTAPGHDLALVKADIQVRDFYKWTPRQQSLGKGTSVAHAGLATGLKGEVGALADPVPGSGGVFGPISFTHSSPVAPGDSGGPVFVASGELVGITSAVQKFGALQTHFFVSSHAVRPDPQDIEKELAADRRRQYR